MKRVKVSIGGGKKKQTNADEEAAGGKKVKAAQKRPIKRETGIAGRGTGTGGGDGGAEEYRYPAEATNLVASGEARYLLSALPGGPMSLEVVDKVQAEYDKACQHSAEEEAEENEDDDDRLLLGSAPHQTQEGKDQRTLTASTVPSPNFPLFSLLSQFGSSPVLAQCSVPVGQKEEHSHHSMDPGAGGAAPEATPAAPTATATESGGSGSGSTTGRSATEGRREKKKSHHRRY